MKILLLTPRGDETLGVVGNFCEKALGNLGHEVATIDFRANPFFWSRAISFLKKKGQRRSLLPPSIDNIARVQSLKDDKINSLVLENVKRYNPEIVLVLMGENIFAQTVRKIREKGIVCVNWMLDTIFVPGRAEFLKLMQGVYDRIFIVDSTDILPHAGVAQDGSIATLPLACFPAVHRRLNLSEKELRFYGSEVAFVGTVTLPRQRILESLSEFNLKIWGRWKQESPILKRYYQGQDVYAQEAVKIYNASKIIIDIHGFFESGKVMHNVTPRVFEVPACGGFLLTNDICQLRTFYKVGEEMIVYRDIAELKRLIRYYLDHPAQRQVIANVGHEMAHQHTYAQRLEQLLAISREGRE